MNLVMNNAILIFYDVATFTNYADIIISALMVLLLPSEMFSTFKVVVSILIIVCVSTRANNYY